MSDNKKSYYAIIPANVRYDESLPPNAKLLYGEITALCNAEGYCWASNKYFADLYGVSPITISRWINALASRGHIASQIIYKKGTNQIDKRYIQICYDPINKNVNTPINEIVKENNTSINNTINITSEYIDKPTRKRFNPPTLEEVQAYCRERNNNVDAEKFINHYTSNGWMVGRTKMQDWKAAVRTWENNGYDKKPTEQNTTDKLLRMIEEGAFDE